MVVRIQSGFRLAAVVGTVLGVTLGSGCSDDSAPGGGSAANSASEPAAAAVTVPVDPAAEPVVDTRTPEEIVEAGRGVYNANCTACHSMDPTQDGALGPAVSGASLSLLEARVLRGKYPEGYAPKRPSRVMIPLPHLKTKLPELAAYLDSLE